MRHENIDLFKSPREEEATIDQMDDRPTVKAHNEPYPDRFKLSG